MNYKSKKDLEIASINLKEDFDMVISFIKTTKDLEVVSEAITKAFQCVPNAQELPSVANEAEENQKAVMKKFEDFLGELQ
jgi:pyruvate kinase